MTNTPAAAGPYPLTRASVLRVREDSCEVWDGQRAARVPFAPVFPTPRTDRVFPGHLVAIATAADGRAAVIWRWFDAVLLGTADDGRVRLWEPGHGEVLAQLRHAGRHIEPGTRVYASSGLFGADWWVAGPVVDGPVAADVELEEVAAFFGDNGLWGSVFGS